MPRPDLAAHRKSLRLPITEIVEPAGRDLGPQAHRLHREGEGCRADLWIARWPAAKNTAMPNRRLYACLPGSRTLREQDTPAVVQAWITGVDPELRDRVPCG